MPISNLHFLITLLLHLALIFSPITADDAVFTPIRPNEETSPVRSDHPEPFPTELEKLTSRIQSLELLVDKKSEELRKKDEIIAAKERAIEEKERTMEEEEERMGSLQNDVASLNVQWSLDSDADEQVEKALTRSEELEKQVEKLQLELEMNGGLSEALETRSEELEESMLEMNTKLQNLQQTIEEQETKLRKTERALKSAEEELTRMRNEATQKVRELTEVYSAWLPLWLAAPLSSSQAYFDARWKQHGKPAFDTITKKAWAKPQSGTVKSKWILAAKQQWAFVVTNVGSRVQLLTKKIKEVYVRLKKVLTPHMIKITKVVDPHFQVAKKFCKPYIDRVVIATKPYLDKARVTTKPYTNKVVQVYGKVKGSVEESLKRHKITRSLATKEFVWFAASALLALPIINLLKALSAMFFRSAKKPTKTSRPSQSRRKAKRAH